MFTHESTENLLDNLECELTEMMELEQPKHKSPEAAGSKKRTPPPVPARRNVQASIDDHPVPASRRLSSLDKSVKNDENEIIQLQSMTSDHDSATSESVQGHSKQNTVIVLNEKKAREIAKASENANETFFVIKHGKWATEQDETVVVSPPNAEEEIQVVKEDEVPEPTEKSKKKKKKVVRRKHESQSSATSVSHTSPDSSSTESSSLEESPRPAAKKKAKKGKGRRRKKDDQSASSCTESGSKRDDSRADAESHDKAIGIFVNSTGSMKYRKTLKSPRVKISFYNKDNGKQVGETYWTSCGKLSNDQYYNLLCSWNETVTASFDIKRLREIYNSILIFFEMVSSENVSVCWAFLRLFSPNSLNIDKKCKLQFFEYQKLSNSCFASVFSKKTLVDMSIFEQWQLSRRKFPCTLNIFVKDFNFAAATSEADAKHEAIPASIHTSASESIQRYWRKIPGQACKIPNKLFRKLPLHDKGSLVVKFSHDGNFLAFSEVSKNGHLLHIDRFPELTRAFTMLEHSDIIHDIDWLKQKTYDQQRLVTASADFTAIVWRLEESGYTYTILPHPAFVYASKFLQNDNSGSIHVVTGGRDNTVRIWRNRNGLQSFELTQELKHPRSSAITFIVAIATRSADTFYTSSSTGDIVEWTMTNGIEYQLSRHFKFPEARGRLINCMELHPRGNKICFRIQDTNDFDAASSIFVMGVPSGTITQRYQQTNMQHENQGILTIAPCGSQIFSTNGSAVRHYQLVNGNVVTAEDERNVIGVKLSLGDKGFVTSMDYHPKDFYLAIATYGATHSNIIVCSYESSEKNALEQMKLGSQETILQKSYEARQTGSFSDIIRRMDEVFMAPPVHDDHQNIMKIHEDNNNNFEDNTFTVESKRSRTYTVSKGPATFTIQNGTYEIQKNDESDEDETTISESFN